MYLIYKLTFPNKKSYIGITNDINKRKNQHIRNCMKKDISKRAISQAILKYGYSNIDTSILEKNLSLEEAKEKEIYYINKYSSMINKNGYNMTMGGDHPSYKSYRHSNEKILEVIEILQENKLTFTEISKKYNISIAVLSNLTNGKCRLDLTKGKKMKRETKMRKGSANGSSKLDENKVSQIKKDLNLNVDRKTLREKYNVSKSTIQGIATEQYWSHVEPKIVKEKNPPKKLSEDDVRVIKRLILEGTNDKIIAGKYGVSPYTIRSIRRNERWSHVTI